MKKLSKKGKQGKSAANGISVWKFVLENSMKIVNRKLKIVFLALLFASLIFYGFVPKPELAHASSTIIASAGTISDITQNSVQPKIFYDGTRWWAFYQKSGTANTLFYAYSSDLSSWTETSVALGGTVTQNGNTMDVYYDSGSGTVLVTYYASTLNHRYLRGNISGTTITWSANSNYYNASSKGSPSADFTSSIIVDSNSKVDAFPDDVGSFNTMQSTNVISTSFADNDGDWTDTGGSANDNWASQGAIMRLASGNMLMVIDDGANDPHVVHWSKYTGTWSVFSATGLVSATNASLTNWGIKRIDDTHIYFLGQSDTSSWQFSVFNGTSWDTSKAQPTWPTSGLASNSGVALSSDGTNIFAFVIRGDANTTVSYNKYTVGSDSWGGWTDITSSAATRAFISPSFNASSASLPVLWTQTNGSNFDIYVDSVSLSAPASSSQTPKIGIPPNYLRINSGLVGYWTFDGNDMIPNARDRSGLGHNGDLYFFTSTTTVPGKIGQALNFDGVDDVIDTNTDEVGTGTVTVCAWIKPSVFSSDHAFVGNGRFIFQISNGFNAFYLSSDGGSNAALSAVAPTLGVWQYACGVRKSGGLATIYVNAVQSGSADQNSGTPSTLSTIAIGDDGNGSNKFGGAIDDVRIYNRALTATEIKALYNSGSAKIAASPTSFLTNGLVGYWTFDGKDVNWSTGAVADRSGNGNTATLTNMTAAGSATAGKIGQGMNFGTTTDGVNIQYAPVTGSGAGSLNVTGNQLSISAWVKSPLVSLKQPDDQHLTVIYKGSGSAGYRMLLEPTGGVLMQVSNGAGDLTTATGGSDAKCTANAWCHIVYSYNGSTAKVYFNGVANATTQSVSANLTSNSGQDARIGATGTDYAFSSVFQFNGIIDDLRVYNRGLSQQEVMALYNSRR